MKITSNEMWDHINKIMFPSGAITAQECGFVIPEALEKCAVKIVTNSGRIKWHIIDEHYVIEALRELQQNGMLTFSPSTEQVNA